MADAGGTLARNFALAVNVFTFKRNKSMSIELKQIFDQVHKLSRAEQLLLISSIAQLLSKEESEQSPDDAIVQWPGPLSLRETKALIRKACSEYGKVAPGTFRRLDKKRGSATNF